MKDKRKKVLVLTMSILLTGICFFAVDDLYAQNSTNPQATPTPAIEEDDEVLKIETELVSMLFTAQDKDRRLLTTLKKNDIRVLEDGIPQEIFVFQRQIDLPLSLAIMIDVSASQERTLPEQKAAAKSFLQDVVRPEKDEVSIISFTGDTTLEQGMTNNIARLGRAVDRVQFVSPSGYIGGGVVVQGTAPVSGINQAAGATAIWDAVWVTSEEVLGTAPDKTRRAIILLTDGSNNYGSRKLNDAVEAVLKANAVVYSIGIGDNFYGGIDEKALRNVSERTGGRAFFPRDEYELRRAFEQIQVEMRSQYLIAYEPTNPEQDGSYRKVEIQFVNPEIAKEKVTLTHRQGYYAKRK